MTALMLLGMGLAQAQEIEPIERTLPASAPRLELNAHQGSVTIERVDESSSRVSFIPVRWHEGCEVRFSGDASVAIASILEEGEPAGRRCTADVVLSLAGETEIDIEMRQARIHTVDFNGPLSVSIKRGMVMGSARQADVTIARVGHISLWGLSEPSSANLGVGNIRLAYEQEVAGDIVANTRAGNISVMLPYGSLINDASETPLGRFVSAIPHHDHAETRLLARSGSGQVRVSTDLAVLSTALLQDTPSGDAASGATADAAGSIEGPAQPSATASGM